MKKTYYLTSALTIFIFAYLLGVLTIQYKLPPYSLLKATYHALQLTETSHALQLTETSHGGNPLSQHFVQPISDYDKLKYPPVTTSEELTRRINEYMVNIDAFENAFNSIQILSSSVDDNILTLKFRHIDSVYTAYAYFRLALDEKRSNTGINIIPGSGINQSSAMIYDRQGNYQSNIDDIAQHYGDTYILVKPNEDFLAIHNGAKKIGEVSFVNHLLNNGSSYSAYYMIQGIALSKFIKQKYDNLYVAGLSVFCQAKIPENIM